MTKAAELAALIGSQMAQSNRNIVINGAMNIAQYSTSETGLGASSGYFTIDRFRMVSSNTAGRFTMSQASVTDLPEFANALKLDCTTADTSIAAAELLTIQTKFEGQNLQQLQKGTSGARSVTVSFYMKTNKAFTFMCEFDDNDNNRFNGQQFTTTTSWTRHVLTFVGDTTGTLDDDNARSAQLNIHLHGGSNFTGGTYSANTWQSRASSDANRAVGIDSFFDSTDNEVQLTGLQMEIGEVATPFEHLSNPQDLAKCQRYYYQVNYDTNVPYLGAGAVYRTTLAMLVMHLPVTMRAAPTAITQSGTAAHYTSWGNEATQACSAVPAIRAGDSRTSVNVDLTFNTLNSATGTYVYRIANTDGYLGVYAEL